MIPTDRTRNRLLTNGHAISSLLFLVLSGIGLTLLSRGLTGSQISRWIFLCLVGTGACWSAIDLWRSLFGKRVIIPGAGPLFGADSRCIVAREYPWPARATLCLCLLLLTLMFGGGLTVIAGSTVRHNPTPENGMFLILAVLLLLIGFRYTIRVLGMGIRISPEGVSSRHTFRSVGCPWKDVTELRRRIYRSDRTGVVKYQVTTRSGCFFFTGMMDGAEDLADSLRYGSGLGWSTEVG